VVPLRRDNEDGSFDLDLHVAVIEPTEHSTFPSDQTIVDEMNDISFDPNNTVYQDHENTGRNDPHEFPQTIMNIH
jgi:hypothetical protein